jgi:hypothetical protein
MPPIVMDGTGLRAKFFQLQKFRLCTACMALYFSPRELDMLSGRPPGLAKRERQRVLTDAEAVALTTMAGRGLAQARFIHRILKSVPERPSPESGRCCEGYRLVRSARFPFAQRSEKAPFKGVGGEL